MEQGSRTSALLDRASKLLAQGYNAAASTTLYELIDAGLLIQPPALPDSIGLPAVTVARMQLDAGQPQMAFQTLDTLWRMPGVIVGASPDPYPPDSRPEWLKPFAHVYGTIPSAPLDLPQRMDTVTKKLKTDGWTVVIRSVGTDFTGPFGFPVPKDQPIDVLLNRTDRAYTADDAQAAITRVLKSVNANYSPISAWSGEVMREVIIPTINDTKKAAQSGASLLPWIAAGLAAVAVIQIAPAINTASKAFSRDRA